MTQVDLQYGAATHVGLVREANEDAHLVAPPVFVVADGMGGHDHGDVASAFVVEEFARLAATRVGAATAADAVISALEAVHDRIDEYDAVHHAAGELLFGSGTTAIVALLVDDVAEPYWLVANLGGTVRHEPDFFIRPADVSGRVLLCSDGVSEMLAHDDIARILDEHPDPAAAAEKVVAAAVAAGGRDNATAVVVDVVGLTRETPYDTVVQQPSTEQETHP